MEFDRGLGRGVRYLPARLFWLDSAGLDEGALLGFADRIGVLFPSVYQFAGGIAVELGGGGGGEGGSGHKAGPCFVTGGVHDGIQPGGHANGGLWHKEEEVSRAVIGDLDRMTARALPRG